MQKIFDSENNSEAFNIITILLTPVILILHNLNFYKTLLFYNDVYFLFAIYLLTPVICYYFFRKVLRLSKSFSVLIVLDLSLMFFFFGAIQDLLLKFSFLRPLSKTYILPLFFLLLISYHIFKKRKAVNILKIFSIGLILFFASELIVFVVQLTRFNEIPQVKETTAFTSNKNVQPDSINVYHIVFDGYGNSASLDNLFGFHNEIDSFLMLNDFYAAHNSKSNYDFTPYSIGATLNMSYLVLQKDHLRKDYKNFFLGTEVYRKNTVFNFFQTRGYSIQHFSLLDDYEYVKRMGTFAPRTPAYTIRNQTLERVFLNPWLWRKLTNSKSNLPISVKKNLDYYKNYNENAYQTLLQASNGKHIFCFVHFFLPHEPYAYQKSVDSLTLHDLNDPSGYIMQVQYANELIKKIVSLLKKKDAIIILQGDHGFREYDRSIHSNMEQMKTLNAFYFPDHNYHSLYDSISLVNTYRVILNQYFQQQLPLLKDEYFVTNE